MTDFQAIHLLCARDKVESTPHLVNELARSVLVQCAEQEVTTMPGYRIGLLVYLRQEGHLIPGKVNPLLYVATIQFLAEQLGAQAIDVTLDRDLSGEPPRRRKSDR